MDTETRPFRNCGYVDDEGYCERPDNETRRCNSKACPIICPTCTHWPQLHAAAREMLDVLQQLVWVAQNSDPEDVWRDAEEAKAVIAKAERGQL